MPKTLTLPADVEAIRALRAGDDVFVSGRIVTARDAAHRHLVRAVDPALRALVAGCAVYPCGPVVAQDPATKAWRFVAAGPTLRVPRYLVLP